MKRFEILPCPFCGGDPYLEQSSRGFHRGVSTRLAYVRCKGCGARGPHFDLAEFGCTASSSRANELAVAAWNRREWG